jgi:hypothetical protein
MNPASASATDPSSNFVIRRGNGGGVGDDRNADDFYERFHRNQYYNAVEDEQIYVDEYTNMIHQYNDFITNGNAMFSRMEQTLRENLTRTLVRQSFYYNSVHNQRHDRVSLAQTPAAAAAAAATAAPTAATAPASAPNPSRPIADTLPRLLSRYLNTEIARDARQPINNNANNNNIFSMLYTIPLEVRTNAANAANAGSGIGAGGGGGSAATNDQIHRATMNTTFGNIISPVNATCPISRDEFNDESDITMIRGCNHIFNRTSLREWFVSHSTCPMCRGDIREYRPQATPTAAPLPERRRQQQPPQQQHPPANLSIDRIDNNEFTFSYDLPVNYNNDQIYQDIVNTVNHMTNYRRHNDQHDDGDSDDDIMEVD